MPNYYRAQVSLANDSGMARDVSQNTWHFRSGSAIANVPDDMAAIVAALETFYGLIESNYSQAINPADGRIKLYNLEDPPARYPIVDVPLVLSATGGPGMPNEVAMCLSFKGATGPGINRRRNSGRVYIGPLASAMALAGEGDTRPTDASVTLLATSAAGSFLPVPPSGTSGAITWCIFSRSTALGLAIGEAGPETEPTYTAAQLELGFREVVTVWVDNAFDTQRRRGLTATSRVTAVA